MADWIQASEIAEKTGISETTIRRFLKTFRHYFPAKKQGRLRFFHPDSVDIANRIKAWYDEGKSTPDIEERLAAAVPRTVDVDVDRGGLAPLPKAAPAVDDRVLAVLEKLIDQRREIGDVDTKISKLEESIKRSIADLISRQEKENQVLRERIETQQVELEKIQASSEPRELTLWAAFLRLFRRG